MKRISGISTNMERLVVVTIRLPAYIVEELKLKDKKLSSYFRSLILSSKEEE